jgi:hypothetical protein
MTTLYLIHFDAHQGDTLQGRIQLINPDAFFFPAGPEFPLQLILEAWQNMKHGYFWDEDQLYVSRDEGVTIADRVTLTDEFTELWGLTLGRKIDITAEEDEQLRRSYDRHQPLIARKYLVRFSAWGSSDGKPYIMTNPDPDEFCWRAAQVIASYQLGEPQHLPPGVDPWHMPEDEKYRALRVPSEHQPHAGFTVTVHDPRYLEHMGAPMRFETAFAGW